MTRKDRAREIGLWRARTVAAAEGVYDARSQGAAAGRLRDLPDRTAGDLEPCNKYSLRHLRKVVFFFVKIINTTCRIL